MKTILRSAGVALVMMMSSTTMAASITYTGVQEVGGGRVDYSFTTDGKIGAINSGNIIDFKFDLSKSGVTYSISRSSADLSFYDGGFFNATATMLFLNPSSLDGSFYTATNDAVIRFYNFNAGTFSVGSFFLNGEASGIGSMPIATSGVVAGVPEPGIWLLMVLGFGALGFAMRRKQAATPIVFA